MKWGHVTGAAALATLAFVPSASAARPELAFDGRCDVYGDVIFRDRVTTEVAENPFVFRTADRLTTCAGTIRIGRKTLPSKTRPFRVVVRGTGQVSCQNSTADDLRGRLILLKRRQGNVFKPRRINERRVALRTTISLEHVLNSVVAQIAGKDGTSAEARATFFPTPEAIQRCGEDGIRTLPFNGTVVTNGELVSE
jgi:hypothetical protein